MLACQRREVAEAVWPVRGEEPTSASSDRYRPKSGAAWSTFPAS